MLLTSIPGISYYSAIIILTELGEIHRFPHPKKLCSYTGLVPRTIQSGDHVYHSRILKECNQNLKWILDQCTHIHTRHCPNSSITRLYHRIENKKGRNKAIVAASRKLLTCIWYMLMKNEMFKYSNDD
jgi:transposase